MSFDHTDQAVLTVAKAAAAKGAEKKSKAGKSPYNKFMKEGNTRYYSYILARQQNLTPKIIMMCLAELARLKKADPKLNHKEAFKQAAANWSKNKPT